MEVLAKMVAEQIKSSMDLSNVKADVKNEVDKYADVEDGGQWAVNSKYYGKEICGFTFNPYMIRWHLQKQFGQLMEDYDNNISCAIDDKYTYMYSIEYTLEEVRKLAMLEERDRLAFDERKLCFDLKSCVDIFTDYALNVIRLLYLKESEAIKKTKDGKVAHIRVSKLGAFNIGKVIDGSLRRSPEYDALLALYGGILNSLKGITSYRKLYELMKEHIYIKLPKKHKKSSAFRDCFIKSGAYYTLKQKLMFNESFTFKGKSGREAVLYLRNQLENENKKGYMFYGMLKEAMNIR